MIRFYHVILTTLIVHTVDATIEWEIERGPQGQPWTLKCRGPKENGYWFKRWNRTDTTLATFDTNAHVVKKDPSFEVTAFLKSTSGIETRLSLPTGMYGTFGCKFGHDHHLFHVPKHITTYSESKPHTVTLKCQDDRYPFNVSWYLNSTFVALSKIYNQSSYTVDDKNTSFTQLKNITIRGDQATTNNTRPVCLTCIVHSNDSFGQYTVCTPGTKDLATSQQTRSDNFRISRLESERSANGNTNAENLVSNTIGLGFVIGSVAVVCAVTGFVLLTHILGRKRPTFGYEQQIYKALSTSSGGTTEISTS